MASACVATSRLLSLEDASIRWFRLLGEVVCRRGSTKSFVDRVLWTVVLRDGVQKLYVLAAATQPGTDMDRNCRGGRLLPCVVHHAVDV
jgi:hypothetical protein